MVTGKSMGRVGVAFRSGAGGWARQERCTHCGAEVAQGDAVEGLLRGVVYVYCADECLELHLTALHEWGAACACGEEVVGDATSCGEHLDGEPGADLVLKLAG